MSFNYLQDIPYVGGYVRRSVETRQAIESSFVLLVPITKSGTGVPLAGARRHIGYPALLIYFCSAAAGSSPYIARSRYSISIMTI